jgi:hypothetical protein
MCLPSRRSNFKGFLFSDMYLITQPGTEPFLTKYFDPENHWQDGMVVFKIEKSASEMTFSTDGITWSLLNVDHL